MAVCRRELLRGFVVAGVSLLWRAPSAAAIGGVLPNLNEPAPPFRLEGFAPSANGEANAAATELSLSNFRGRWLVLYFYPRDFTEGCTLEARGFQRDLQAFHSAGAEVVGVSADSAASHTEFCGSEGLVFPLLSDPGGLVSRSYGSWIAPFSQRHTFLIDPQGSLRASWVAVRPAGHSTEVLAELVRLKGES
jgi:peroxiredoxin Q/BCP